MCLRLRLWLLLLYYQCALCGCGCVLRPVGDKLFDIASRYIYTERVCVCVCVCVCVYVCRPVGDKLLDINDLERFLRENLKVQGKTGNLVPALYVYVCMSHAFYVYVCM